MKELIAYLLLFVHVRAHADCTGDKAECSQDTIFLQRVLMTEHVHGQDLEDASGKKLTSGLGRLDHFDYHDIDGDNCMVKGTWSDEGYDPVEFHASHKQVLLNIGGVPKIAQHLTKEPPSFQVGNVEVTLDQLESDKALRSIISHVTNSSFLDKRAKHLSSLLGRHGLDGGRSMCARRLHFLLLGLAKSFEKKKESWFSDSWPEPCELGARRRDIGHRRRGWSEYSFADGCNADDECGCDLAAVPYGSGTGCQKERTSTWKCHVEPHGAWHQPPHNSFKRPRDAFEVENIVCQDQTQLTAKQEQIEMKCPGMCGRECDCWESVCSGKYACEYNPYCCGHDMQCSRRRVGSYQKCYFQPVVGLLC